MPVISRAVVSGSDWPTVTQAAPDLLTIIPLEYASYSTSLSKDQNEICDPELIQYSMV
jgi:hypothetical protein